MSWKPCPICGADGYRLRPLRLGWACVCPQCDSILTQGATQTQAVMFYTATHRRVQA